MTKQNYQKGISTGKAYAVILVALFVYALGFCAFILPHSIVIGGMAGLGTLVYFASGQFIPVSVTMYSVNLMLIICGYKMLGREFTIRTIYGATVASVFVGLPTPP